MWFSYQPASDYFEFGCLGWIELRWCIVLIADACEEIDDEPIVETVYMTEKGEEYLGQVNYVTSLILLLFVIFWDTKWHLT